MTEQTIRKQFTGTVLTRSVGSIQVQINGKAVWCRFGVDKVEEQPVVGDQVLVELWGEPEGRFLAIQPRRSKLSRLAAAQGYSQHEHVMAANVDLVVPVFAAAKPNLKWRLVDRYLVLAEAAGLPALLCITKMDHVRSMKPKQKAEFEAGLKRYREIGYPIIETCSPEGLGMDTVRDALAGKTTILMGKSGVGKTSLMNAIMPGYDLKVKAVGKQREGKGRHTTTAMTAYPLNGGYVIDAPGIRELGLWDVYPEELANHFPEMRPYLGKCKFRLNCTHEEEPGCAVRQAVMDGKIDPERYQSYLRLKEEDDA